MPRREEIQRLNSQIRSTERSSRQAARLRKEVTQQKALLASGKLDTGLRALAERRIADLNTEIKAVENAIGKIGSAELKMLEEKSDALFKKFVATANLRPSRKVTAMGYTLNDADYNEMKNRHQGELVPPIHCSGCHR